MRRFGLAIAVVVVLGATLLVSSGCGASSASDLGGSTWVLGTFIGADGQPNDVIEDTRIDAVFQGDQISGSAGCNSYSGNFEVDGDALAFDAIAVTEMWCESPEGVMDQELEYLGMLSSADAYTVEGTTLTLFDSTDSAIAVFRAEE